MKKKLVLFAVGMAFFALCLAFTLPYFFVVEESAPQKVVLELWNIDTFEGGKGSRTSFLKGVARAFEKKVKNVYFLVRSYPLSAALLALQTHTPSLLSYGLGVGDIREKCLPLPLTFFNGEDCLAYPWARGRYYLFCKENTFENVTAENTVLSDGGQNVVWAAGAYSGLHGEVKVQPSTEAYLSFLRGKYTYLLGTQRDICRFSVRGEEVYSQPLSSYCDLFQMISVTEEAQSSLSFKFVQYLLSAEVQEKLTAIGMESYQVGQEEYAPSVFLSGEGVTAFKQAAVEAMESGNLKKVKSFVKRLN